MRLQHLNENVFHLKGNAAGFLNGITSNTLEAPLNAFLNQHGRLIATIRQRSISDDEFLIAVPAVAVESLFKHLERYIKLSRVTVTPGTEKIFIDIDTAQTVWSTDVHADSVGDEAFMLFRLDHHIPLMGIDYQAEEFILNVHEHDYTSYTKGCFLGQEPVAKVHNRSQPTRKLVVRFEDQCSVEESARMTSRVKDPVSGKIKGFVFVSNKPLP